MSTIERIKQLLTIARQNALEGMTVVWQFDYEELAKIYNGIGPDRFPDWLRKIVTEANGLFEPAALIHDVEYHIGGTREDFTAANDRFRRNCDLLIRKEYPWWSPMRYMLLNRVRRWANYCEMFGADNYHFKNGTGEGTCEFLNGKQPNG